MHILRIVVKSALTPDQGADALLSVRALTVGFGGVLALDGADLSVRRGSITGLIGPNGAGKSTLINAISGFVRGRAGSVMFDGSDITARAPDEIGRAGLIRTFQLARGFPRLSVFENLLLYGTKQPGERMWGALTRRGTMRREMELRDKALGIAARLRLQAVLDSPAGAISGGQKKLLEIGRALMGEPKLILLDEPVAGVNPSLAREIVNQLLGLKPDGLTLLVVEHDMGFIERLCDHVVVMAAGRRLMQGAFSEVRADPRVQEAYLGSGAGVAA